MNDIFNRNNGSLFDENGNTNDAFLSLVQTIGISTMNTSADFEVIEKMLPLEGYHHKMNTIDSSMEMSDQEKLAAYSAADDKIIADMKKIAKLNSWIKVQNVVPFLLVIAGSVVLLKMLGGQGTMNGLTSLLPVKIIK